MVFNSRDELAAYEEPLAGAVNLRFHIHINSFMAARMCHLTEHIRIYP